MDYSVIPNLSGPIGIVCHDAGGANQVLALLKHIRQSMVFGYMEGPSKTIWEGKYSNATLSSSLLETLTKINTLITGTGWASDLEHNARKEAKRLGVYTIAVMDHWTNYPERFTRDDQMILPDELWVVDNYAQVIARNTFPSLKVIQIHDYYSEEIASQIRPIDLETPDELLYLLEPYRSNWGRQKLGEFQALEYFIKLLPHLELSKKLVVRLRPHPSDYQGKYDVYLNRSVFGYQIVLDEGDLASSLSQARWVAGCQTYAMALALKAERTVFCTLPPWAPPCQLPHCGLIHLKDIQLHAIR